MQLEANVKFNAIAAIQRTILCIVYRFERNNLFNGVRLSARLIYESKSGEI